MADVIVRVNNNKGTSSDIYIKISHSEDELYNTLKGNEEFKNLDNATIVVINNKGFLERIFNPLDKSFTEFKDRFTRAKIRAEAGEDTVNNLQKKIEEKTDRLSNAQNEIKNMPFFRWIRSFFITDQIYASQSQLMKEIAVLKNRCTIIQQSSSDSDLLSTSTEDLTTAQNADPVIGGAKEPATHAPTTTTTTTTDATGSAPTEMITGNSVAGVTASEDLTTAQNADPVIGGAKEPATHAPTTTTDATGSAPTEMITGNSVAGVTASDLLSTSTEDLTTAQNADPVIGGAKEPATPLNSADTTGGSSNTNNPFLDKDASQPVNQAIEADVTQPDTFLAVDESNPKSPSILNNLNPIDTSSTVDPVKEKAKEPATHAPTTTPTLNNDSKTFEKFNYAMIRLLCEILKQASKSDSSEAAEILREILIPTDDPKFKKSNTATSQATEDIIQATEDIIEEPPTQLTKEQIKDKLKNLLNGKKIEPQNIKSPASAPAPDLKTVIPLKERAPFKKNTITNTSTSTDINDVISEIKRVARICSVALQEPGIKEQLTAFGRDFGSQESSVNEKLVTELFNKIRENKTPIVADLYQKLNKYHKDSPDAACKEQKEQEKERQLVASEENLQAKQREAEELDAWSKEVDKYADELAGLDFDARKKKLSEQFSNKKGQKKLSGFVAKINQPEQKPIEDYNTIIKMVNFLKVNPQVSGNEKLKNALTNTLGAINPECLKICQLLTGDEIVQKALLPIMTVFRLEYESKENISLLITTYKSLLEELHDKDKKDLLAYACSLFFMVTRDKPQDALNLETLNTFINEVYSSINSGGITCRIEIITWVKDHYGKYFEDNLLENIKDASVDLTKVFNDNAITDKITNVKEMFKSKIIESKDFIERIYENKIDTLGIPQAHKLYSLLQLYVEDPAKKAAPEDKKGMLSASKIKIIADSADLELIKKNLNKGEIVFYKSTYEEEGKTPPSITYLILDSNKTLISGVVEATINQEYLNKLFMKDLEFLDKNNVTKVTSKVAVKNTAKNPTLSEILKKSMGDRRLVIDVPSDKDEEIQDAPTAPKKVSNGPSNELLKIGQNQSRVELPYQTKNRVAAEKQAPQKQAPQNLAALKPKDSRHCNGLFAKPTSKPRCYIDCKTIAENTWYNYDTKSQSLIKYSNKDLVGSCNLDSLGTEIKEKINETCESGYGYFELDEECASAIDSQLTNTLQPTSVRGL